MPLVLYQPLVRWPARYLDIIAVSSPTASFVVTKEKAQVSDVAAILPESTPEEIEPTLSGISVRVAPVELCVAHATASDEVATPVENTTLVIPVITLETRPSTLPKT